MFVFYFKIIKLRQLQKRPPRLFAPPPRLAPLENVRRLPLSLLVFVEYFPDGGVYMPRSGNFLLAPSKSAPVFDRDLLIPSCF